MFYKIISNFQINYNTINYSCWLMFLTRYHRRFLSPLRTNKSPFILSYLYKINPSEHPSPLWPLVYTNTDNTYSNWLLEQSLRGGRAAGYLAASPGGALPRTKWSLGGQQQQCKRFVANYKFRWLLVEAAVIRRDY